MALSHVLSTHDYDFLAKMPSGGEKKLKVDGLTTRCPAKAGMTQKDRRWKCFIGFFFTV